jgi:hypothetical protein
MNRETQENAGETVTIQGEGAAVIRGENISINQGGAGVITGNNVSVRDGGAMVIAGQTVSVRDGGGALIMANQAVLNDAGVFFLATRTIGGDNVRVFVDVKAATVLGLFLAGLVAFLTFFRRSKS